jgi:hypothetical protein
MGNVRDISLDIEACGDVVVSIGACEFDLVTGDIGETRYWILDLQKQLNAGLKMDGKAFEWWLTLSNEARQAVTASVKRNPAAVIEELRAFIWHDKEAARVWAYPTSYDLPVIARMCGAFKVKVPWRWTETMDARTLWKLALMVKPDLARVEIEATIEHHALADAEQQAKWIVAYMKPVLEGR